MTLIRLTGSQLHAARVMVGLSRDALAERAGLCRHSIRKDNMTDEMIEAAIAANDRFVRALEKIAADDEFARLSMAAALEASPPRRRSPARRSPPRCRRLARA